MKTQVVNQTYFVLILATVLIAFGTQGTSYGQTITASTPQPLTEATLHGSVVTLTLSGGTYERSSFRIERVVTLSGIDGATIANFFGVVDRVSDTVVTIELAFDGNIDADGTLTFTVGADAIANYTGSALTAQVPVTAVAESLVATLHGSVLTLMFSGRQFVRWRSRIRDALTLSGIDGVTFVSRTVDRVSSTEVIVQLTFEETFDTDSTLTVTVGAEAIEGYNDALTAQVLVVSLEESLIASTEFSLTEVNLHGSIVTLTLKGAIYERYFSDIADMLTASGIDGVTFESRDVERVNSREVTIELTFDGDFDTDAILIFTVGAGGNSRLRRNTYCAACRHCDRAIKCHGECVAISNVSACYQRTVDALPQYH